MILFSAVLTTPRPKKLEHPQLGVPANARSIGDLGSQNTEVQFAVQATRMSKRMRTSVPNKYTKSYSLQGLPIQEVSFTFDNLEHVIQQQIIQHPVNIATNDYRITRSTINYPLYSLRGNLLTENDIK